MTHFICNVVVLKYCLNFFLVYTIDPIHCFQYTVCKTYLVLFLRAEAGEGNEYITHAIHVLNHWPTPPNHSVLILSHFPGRVRIAICIFISS